MRTILFQAACLLSLLPACTSTEQSGPQAPVAPISSDGFEAYRLVGEPSPEAGEQATQLVDAIASGQVRHELLSQAPDVELQAFRLGSENPELYSVWLERRMVYPGSYRQALELGLVHRPQRVFLIPPGPTP